MRTTATRLLAWVPLLATACFEGRPGRSDGNDSAADDGRTGPDGGEADEGSDPDGGTSPIDDAFCGPLDSPLRRMSNTQYVNTLEDLFGENHDFSTVLAGMPVDPTSHGFENAAELQIPSPALVEGYYRGATTVAQSLLADATAAEALIEGPIPTDRTAAVAIGEGLIEDYGRRMFRRPLSDDEFDRYSEIFAANFEDSGLPEDDFIVALGSAFQAMLQAPQFLYLVERGVADGDPGELVRLTDYEIASRLSYFLWDSMPDEALFEAAEAGALGTVEAIEDEARRMLEAPRAKTALRNFHRQWLHFDSLLDEMKDLSTHPQWSEELLTAEYEQMNEFIDRVMFDGDGTIAALLTSNEFPVNARLASLFGVEMSGEGWQSMQLDPAQRRGFLTLPGWLAAQAHPVDPSPVLRGVFVRDHLLCSPLPPPPDDVDATPPEQDETTPLTNRERYVQHTVDPSCAGCHNLIDGIGFPFENYDSIGAFRTQDDGQPVDASGNLLATGDTDGPVANALELIDKLAISEAVEQCVTKQWFRYGFAREPSIDGAETCRTDELQTVLHESGGDMRELMVAIVTSNTFAFRRVPGT